MDELLKPHLQKTIEKHFAKSLEECESSTVGIICGIIPAYIRQPQSGQFSENKQHQNLGNTWEEFHLREGNRETASDMLTGFLYGIEAAGIITEDEGDALRKEVWDIRLDENRDTFLQMLKNTPSAASVEL